MLSRVWYVGCSATETGLGSRSVHMWPFAHSLPPWFVAWCLVAAVHEVLVFSAVLDVLVELSSCLRVSLGQCKSNCSCASKGNGL